MFTITTASLRAVIERSTFPWALVAAVAVSTILDTGILVALAVALGGAHGGGHRRGGEAVLVEGTRASVIGIAALVEVLLPVVVTAGGVGARRVAWASWSVFVKRVYIDAILITTGLSRITRAGLVALGEGGKVGVNKVVSAVAFSAPFNTSKAVVLGVAPGSANSRGHVVTVHVGERKSAVLGKGQSVREDKT